MLALIAVAPSFAQSTGSQEFDQQIVVTGGKAIKDIQGVSLPETPKARYVLTQEFIKNQRAGQSIDDLINMIPGVSFQNNDAYGNSGGTLNIHGFDASRISQTFDGIPLNDTGNYAIYSQQQLDSELIDQVNVSLGSTDIDSPTASATGSTVNYTTRNPTEDFHVRLAGSFGEYAYLRMFGVVDTGVFTPFGTRAFVSASHAENRNPFNHASKVDKYQYNGKVYQPIGSNGDFISVAANYNIGRNNNFSSIPLRYDANRTVGPSSTLNRFPLTRDEREYNLGSCQTAAARPGVADAPNTCGTLYDYSFNPGHTGSIRANSRFTLADGLVLTVDPSFQIVHANGGNSAVQGYEYGYTRTAGNGLSAITTPLTGYIGGKPYFGGVDLNGDGDTKDSVELYAPSLTRTHRWVILTSLRYDVTPTQTVRVSYTFDHGRHRQTGEVGYLGKNGYSLSLFPSDNPIRDVNGNVMEKRNRLSYAILNQVSGEYRGQFFDSKLTVNAGVRAPFFKRDLTNNCVSESGGNGFVDCLSTAADTAAFLKANPTYVGPMHRVLNYNKVLPSAGLVYNFVPHFSLFASYDKGLQVPGTDSLYNAFALSASNPASKPKPETTDNLNGGVRYKSNKVQAELSGWYTFYQNRLASSYDPDLNITIYRNLGTVHKYGVDGSVSYQPIPQVTLYGFGSYLKSKILGNVQTGITNGVPVYAQTAGKRESGAPTYTLGARAQGNLGALELGAQVKRTGPRYINDQNLPVVVSGVQVYGAKTPAYTLVDLDARISLAALGMNDRTYVQLSVTNLFDKLFVGGFSSNTSNSNVPNAYIGAPRTISGTINFGF
jgi:iron complex outermembrane receptor protein